MQNIEMGRLCRNEVCRRAANDALRKDGAQDNCIDRKVYLYADDCDLALSYHSLCEALKNKGMD